MKASYAVAIGTSHGPLSRYVKLRVAHSPGMPGIFPRHRLQRKPLVSDPGMHYGTCATHVPWCMLVSLINGGGENVPGINGACATSKFTYLARGPWSMVDVLHSLCWDVLILLHELTKASPAASFMFQCKILPMVNIILGKWTTVFEIGATTPFLVQQSYLA